MTLPLTFRKSTSITGSVATATRAWKSICLIADGSRKNKDLIADVQAQIDRDRDIPDASPFPKPEDATTGVFLDNSVKIPFKYGPPKVKEVKKGTKIGEASNVSHYK